MKKLLLLLCSGISFLTSEAQLNTLFPDSNAQWKVKEWDGFGNVAGYVNYYFTNADTVINSQVYHQLFVLPQTTFFSPQAGYHGAIRKDTSLGKVFIVPEDSLNEYILYDFSAGVGDTVHDVFSEMDFVIPSLSTVRIDIVDSMQVNGIWFKRLQHHCVNSFCGSMWIEMIGGEGGPLAGIEPASVSSTAQLSCMSYNDTIYYPAYSIGYCTWLSTGIQKPDVGFTLSVSPNPGKGIFKLETGEERLKKGHLKIYNTLGELVFTLTLNAATESIDISQLDDGIYFVVLENGQSSGRQKIIKKQMEQ